MTDDITKLIAEARSWGAPGAPAVDLIHRLADALEAEHQRAVNAEVRAVAQTNEAHRAWAERDALRTENRKLIDKLETAMGVSEENDALRILAAGLHRTVQGEPSDATLAAAADAIARARGYINGACLAEHYRDARAALRAAAETGGKHRG